MFDRYNRLNCTLTPPAQPPPGYHFPAGYHFQAGYSTFDWDRARYSSPYLVFVHRDLIDRNLHMLQGLPSGELALFNRYVRRSGYPGWKDAVWRTAIDSSLQEPEHRFPLVGVGNYLETGSNVAIYGDLIGYLGAYGMLLPFSTVQESLQRGGPVGHAPSSLIFDFNAETNVTTALICHADHLQPRTVCSRKPIQSILKHIR